MSLWLRITLGLMISSPALAQTTPDVGKPPRSERPGKHAGAIAPDSVRILDPIQLPASGPAKPAGMRAETTVMFGDQRTIINVSAPLFHHLGKVAGRRF